MFKYLSKKLNALIDSYVMKRIRETNFKLTESQIGFLREKANADILRSIYDTYINSVVASSLTARTPDDILRRDEWIKCLGYLKKELGTGEKKKKYINPYTKEEMSAAEWTERYGTEDAK